MTNKSIKLTENGANETLSDISLHEKIPYSPPLIEVISIYMESGIATGSATLTPRMDSNGNTLDIETDWENKDHQTIDVTFW